MIDPERIPVIDREIIDLIERDCIPGGTRDNLKLARETVDWGRTNKTQRILLSDAQTSGGLLLSVAPRRLPAVLTLLKRNGAAGATIIGQITRSRKRLICTSA
jgi:selenide, water dikinase